MPQQPEQQPKVLHQPKLPREMPQQSKQHDPKVPPKLGEAQPKPPDLGIPVPDAQPKLRRSERERHQPK